MSEPVRLYIITDDPERAAAYVFECPPAAIPPWARIVTGTVAISAIPDGIRCVDLWYSEASKNPSALAWDIRKSSGRVRLMDDRDWDRLVRGLAHRRTNAPAQPAAPGPQQKQSRWR
jgi:hypothetical protein